MANAGGTELARADVQGRSIAHPSCAPRHLRFQRSDFKFASGGRPPAGAELLTPRHELPQREAARGRSSSDRAAIYSPRTFCPIDFGLFICTHQTAMCATRKRAAATGRGIAPEGARTSAEESLGRRWMAHFRVAPGSRGCARPGAFFNLQPGSQRPRRDTPQGGNDESEDHGA